MSFGAFRRGLPARVRHGVEAASGQSRSVAARACLGTVSALAFGWSFAPAHAQTQPPTPQQNADVVIVTGSRIQTDGFSAPTPTSVFDESMLDEAAEGTIAEALNTIPSFQPSRTATTNTLNSVSAGANFLDLRGLGANRTLVLLDGRRIVPTTDTNLVDANLIPSALVQRVEVVTGGASAAWGSDAVAGVVNFILDEKLEGFRGTVQGGRSSKGDADEYKVALAYGLDFADGRGNFVIGAEAFDNDGILDQSQRDWASPGWQFISNPAYAAGNGKPRQLIARNVRLSTATPGGLISSGPLRGTQFGPGGAPGPFAFGQVTSTFQIGGDGVNLGAGASIYQPNDRQSAFSRLTFDVSDSLTLFAEAGYARSQSNNPVLPAWNFGTIRVTNDNAYLPASTRAAMATAGITSFNMGRIFTDFGDITSKNLAETYRYVVGAKGDIAPGWSWDAYYEHGHTLNAVDLYNNPIVSRWTLAMDAVVNPANGQVVCRSTLTDPTNGCLPLNIFGPDAARGSPALAYVLGSSQVDYELSQDVFAANVNGKLFDLWAGPLSVAAGVERRTEEVESRVDALSKSSAFLTGNFQPIIGEREVTEGYAEFVVPLLRDLPFALETDLNLAARITDYSTSGTVETYKVGATHRFNDELRLRGTWSRDIRAPNLNELFNPSALTFATVNDPVKGANVTIQQIQKGNTALQPEEAETLTAGFVYEPSWLRGFQASVDYFDIDLTGAIALLGIQDTINRCVAGNAELCGFLTRDSGGNLVSIVRTNYNLAGRATSGLDFQLGYDFPLDSIGKGLPGDVSLNLFATWVDKLVFDDGRTAIDRVANLSAGTSGVPEWKWTATAGYKVGAFAFQAQGRYLSSGVYDSTYGPLDINNNKIEAVTYLDLYLGYDLQRGDDGRSISLFAAVDNALDEAPPVAASSFFVPLATNPILYDVMGRYFTVGLRFKQ